MSKLRRAVVPARGHHREKGVYVQREWLKKEFHLNLRISSSGVVLALGYAMVFWATRQMSVDQFYLPAGIRVAALLVCPPRTWPYLMVGEYAFFAQARFPLIDQYGLAWVVLASALLMPTVAAIVYLHRRRLAAGNPAWLLSIAALSAVAITALNQGLAYLLMPTLHDAVSWMGVAKYIIGDYLGILIFAPVALLWKHRHHLPHPTAGAAMMAVTTLTVIGALGLAAMQLPADDLLAKSSLRIAMLLPAAALTCMYGWRGAAISVAGLNLTIGLTLESSGLPGSFDPVAFLAQQVLAVTGTALLLLGSTISYYYRQFNANDRLGRRAASLVRTAHLASEESRREQALRMQTLGEDIDRSLQMAADLLKQRGHLASAMDMLRRGASQSRLFREQISMVYPSDIEYAGLYVALQSGGVAGTWDATDRVARPRFSGDPCQLSLGLQLAAYRSLVDAVGVMLKHESGFLRVRAHCGRRGEVQGIVITVALLDPQRTLTAQTVARANEVLGGRALAYGGNPRCRRNRLRLVLVETRQPYRVPSGLSIDQITPRAVL